MAKNDIVVRTAQDLERKYNFASLLGLKKNVEITSQGLNKIENELSKILNTLQINLKDVLGNQSEISLWFFSGIPTKENEPYVSWDDLEEHNGDIYYDKDSGSVYQFNGSEWELNVDPNLIEAMAITNAETDTTEDHERKVFFNTPVIPYSNGDWWIKEDGTLFICQISKTTGELENNDFIKADNYTDSVAEKLENEIKVLKGTITLISDNFAKFTDLATGGSTIISGDNIMTGTISAERIEGYENLVLSVKGTETKVNDLESSVNYFSVDLSQYNLTIPTDSKHKPLETKDYDVNFYAYYKGKQITPEVSIVGNSTGITATLKDTYIRFSVLSGASITNTENEYTAIFKYTSDAGEYTINKKIYVVLALQGSDGTSVNILGSYDSLAALKAAHPTGNTGDAYLINGDMYVWSAEENNWTNVGNIQGPQGEQGPQGIQGPKGEDGESNYFYVKYSANSNGNPMTDNPTSTTKYIGVACTTSATAPTSYSGYTWTLIKGADGSNGSPGKDGENGLTSYLHIKYSQDGLAFTPADSEYGLGEKPSAYIGQYVDYTETDSTNFDDYKWYKFTEDIDETLDQMKDDINHANENINNTYTEVVKLQTDVALNKESFEVSVSQLTQTINTNNTSMQESIDDINNTISNGVELVKNKLVTIDINGISVTTSTSAISTLLSNDRFSIKTKSNDELFFVGYDYDLQKTVSRIDNLTVANYLTAGYHRTEGFVIDGEYRTGDFYVGE